MNPVKKIASLVVLASMVAYTTPVFADSCAKDKCSTQVQNAQSGARNVSTGWVEVLDSTHAEASKGKNTGENLTGVVAGGAIGVRKGIHRIGAGAIDLLTFWIPKKKSLVEPEKARLV